MSNVSNRTKTNLRLRSQMLILVRGIGTNCKDNLVLAKPILRTQSTCL